MKSIGQKTPISTVRFLHVKRPHSTKLIRQSMAGFSVASRAVAYKNLASEFEKMMEDCKTD